MYQLVRDYTGRGQCVSNFIPSTRLKCKMVIILPQMYSNQPKG
jgi:hypothetical protein